MLNQVVLIGRIFEDINGNTFIISVPRSFKNEFGEYEKDNIRVKISNNIAYNTIEYCKKGSLIGVKGRLQQSDNGIELIGEKLTFLSSDRG